MYISFVMAEVFFIFMPSIALVLCVVYSVDYDD
jgi:hypothetical protein